MILIADSGSTKSSWALCDKKGEVIKHHHTIGFNPYFINQKKILQHLEKSTLKKYQHLITKVFFYGAGCHSKEMNKIVKNPFNLFFIHAEIIIKNDLEAACYSVYNEKENITCILGTGSNSCFFDGKVIVEHAPSLGFITGDEASGNYFGKKIISLYFNKILPDELTAKFEAKFETNIEIVNNQIYNNNRANIYLAQFFPFIYENKNNALINDLIIKSLDKFFNLHIACYQNYKNTEVNFVGSVAFLLSEQIHKVAKRYNCKVNKIIKAPINKLIEYHFKNSVVK